MKEEDIPDLNIFMMCERLNPDALTQLAPGFSVRSCRPEELDIWKAFPFDNDALAVEYRDFMTDFFTATYGGNRELFFKNTLFVCDKEDRPVATCARWKAYGKINTIHWFKTLKSHEGNGIGRALFSIIMQSFEKEDYPVFLHTQPGSFRAIKLYADFGFSLLSGDRFGTRTNGLEQSIPILKEFMPEKDFDRLKIVKAPKSLLEALKDETKPQF